MPRYYFDVENHGSHHDTEGNEMADAEAARTAAVVFAGEYLRDNPDLVWDGRRFSVHVRDESGTVLLDVRVEASDPAG